MKIGCLFLVIILSLTFLVACETPRTDSNIDTIINEEKGVNIAELSDSVFKLSVADDKGNLIAEGSGFCIFDSKTLITNYHVIENGYSVTAASQNEIIYNVAGVCYYDKDRDIAVLKLENSAKCPVLPIAEDYKVGEEIYAIGSPLGLKNTISNGLISAERENGEYIDLQISAPISSGSSGGALLNVNGEVVGVTYAGMIDGQNLNFAIPMSYFNDIDLNDIEIKTLPNIIEENTPGNLLVNYSGRSRDPFVLDFTFNNNFFVVYEYSYDGESGLIIKSNDLGIEKKLVGYGCPNYYKKDLYFIEHDTGRIVTINIEDILSEKYAINCVVDLSDCTSNIKSIFVNNGKIISRTGDRVIVTNMHGDIIFDFEDEGLHDAIMTDFETLAYAYGENSIKTLNLNTFVTDVKSIGFNFSCVNGYDEGDYLLGYSSVAYGEKKNINYIYNLTTGSVEEFNIKHIDAIRRYKCFLIIHDMNGRKWPGFYATGQAYDGDVFYSYNIVTGSKFKVPVKLSANFPVNYGINDKMYVMSDQENGCYLYRMNLDCTKVEKIGLVWRGE